MYFIGCLHGNGIQFKKNGGYVQNTTSLGTITKITFVAQEGKTNSGLTVYAGTSASDISTSITGTDGEFDFTGGDYSFFKIINNSSSAQYLSSFVVEYN